jgi:phosphatidylglycerophosphatase A
VPESFFAPTTWYRTLIIFVLFRLFDVAKPWPIRSSQSLAGGWGITVDDFLAAAYVLVLSLILLWLF